MQFIPVFLEVAQSANGKLLWFGFLGSPFEQDSYFRARIPNHQFTSIAKNTPPTCSTSDDCMISSSFFQDCSTRLDDMGQWTDLEKTCGFATHKTSSDWDLFKGGEFDKGWSLETARKSGGGWLLDVWIRVVVCVTVGEWVEHFGDWIIDPFFF